MPLPALTSGTERVKLALAAKLTGASERTLQAFAAQGKIPGAAKLGKCWTFNIEKLLQHFKKPLHSAAIYRLNNNSMRMLNRDEAASHLGISNGDFDRFLQLGQLPEPLIVNDRPVWPIHNLGFIKRRRKNHDRQQGVYVIGFDAYVKIGVSADVKTRLFALQEHLPAKLTIYRIFVGEGREGEAALHRHYADYRLRGEWFRKDGRLADWIEGGCR